MIVDSINDSIHILKQAVGADVMNSLIDEFDKGYNGIGFQKQEKIGNDIRSRPFWSNIKKPSTEDQFTDYGDILSFIKWAEVYKYSVKKILRKNVELIRINTNIQYYCQETTFHQDGGPDRWTLLLFLATHWDTNWGGEFICQYKDTYHGIPFIPGNAVLFNANLWHRGSAPNIMARDLRRSIAFTYSEVI